MPLLPLLSASLAPPSASKRAPLCPRRPTAGPDRNKTGGGGGRDRDPGSMALSTVDPNQVPLGGRGMDVPAAAVGVGEHHVHVQAKAELGRRGPPRPALGLRGSGARRVQDRDRERAERRLGDLSAWGRWVQIYPLTRTRAEW